MQVGMVGLGRMGGGMAERLRRAGHEVVGYTRGGGGDVASLDELVARLAPPRTVWVSVPAGAPTEEVVFALAERLAPGDLVVDSGNANFKETQRRAEALASRGLMLADAGTSGGVWGLESGYCIMFGGAAEAFARAEPALRALAPEGGYAHVGPPGAGHFVKMVHNGIEYGMMQAYAEGFEILERAKDYDLDLAAIAELWRHGTVIRSWLLDLAALALAADPGLERLRPYVEDSGEGRWTVLTAIDEDVPAPVIALSLFARFASRDDNSFGNRLLAALRQQFGGHAVRDR